METKLMTGGISGSTVLKVILPEILAWMSFRHFQENRLRFTQQMLRNRIDRA